MVDDYNKAKQSQKLKQKDIEKEFQYARNFQDQKFNSQVEFENYLSRAGPVEERDKNKRIQKGENEAYVATQIRSHDTNYICFKNTDVQYVAKFWKLILEKETDLIVMLFYNSESKMDYFSTKINDVKQCSYFKIKTMHRERFVNAHGLLIFTNKLKIHYEYGVHELTVLEMDCYKRFELIKKTDTNGVILPDDHQPTDPAILLLGCFIGKSLNVKPQKPVVVLDKLDGKKTGTFILAHSMAKHFGSFNFVTKNVLDSIIAIRSCGIKCIPDGQELKFLFQTIIYLIKKITPFNLISPVADYFFLIDLTIPIIQLEQASLVTDSLNRTLSGNFLPDQNRKSLSISRGKKRVESMPQNKNQLASPPIKQYSIVVDEQPNTNTPNNNNINPSTSNAAQVTPSPGPQQSISKISANVVRCSSNKPSPSPLIPSSSQQIPNPTGTNQNQNTPTSNNQTSSTKGLENPNRTILKPKKPQLPSVPALPAFKFDQPTNNTVQPSTSNNIDIRVVNAPNQIESTTGSSSGPKFKIKKLRLNFEIDND